MLSIHDLFVTAKDISLLSAALSRPWSSLRNSRRWLSENRPMMDNVLLDGLGASFNAESARYAASKNLLALSTVDSSGAAHYTLLGVVLSQ